MEENELINVNNEDIKNLIYTIRGKQVMLDRDLAKLYNCKNGTKTINQAVKRNIDRFPERFMFQISENEYKILRSQIGTAKFNIKDKKFSVCLYRTRGCYVIQCFTKQNSYRSQHTYYACICCSTAIFNS